ncbi:hypothetical protein [Bradyrhizobium sp. LTSP885]|uniref:hypothetical protein n=1 Tax=Bradyrhizobium sp. LTSP885 TaxID=1619232 RepID=UPI0012E02C54|nr:hypothetical protein [Bradyrhizobium sp. LTSP885]
MGRLWGNDAPTIAAGPRRTQGHFRSPNPVFRRIARLLVNNPYMTGQTIAMSGGMAFN